MGQSFGSVSSNIDQNGYTSGSLTNISIGTDGSVVGNYSNGQVAKVAQIGIAQDVLTGVLEDVLENRAVLMGEVDGFADGGKPLGVIHLHAQLPAQR